MIPLNEMPPIGQGNQNFPPDEMPLAIGGNHNFLASPTRQVNLVDDGLAPSLEEVKPNVTDDENQDACSENEQLDEQTSNIIPRKRKHYHRHTQHQIQYMEAFFKQFPHPDQKQRRELGQELGLDPLQVKFWFQNKRTQIKAQYERKENTQLRVENEKLRCENIKLKQSTCSNCGNLCNGMPSAEHSLRLENAQLLQEIARLKAMVKSVFSNIGKFSIPSLPLNQGSLEFGAGTSGGQLDNMPSADIFSWSQSIKPQNCLSEQHKAFVIERAVSAMEEVTVMARIGEPLWFLDLDRDTLVLNEQQYFKMFHKESVPKHTGFRFEASRECVVVIMSPFNILEIFMEMSKWLAVFSCMISKAILLDVLSTGAAGDYNGAMEVISAEFQVLCPVVPTRDYVFVRYCKQLNEETWAIVDFSVDTFLHKDPITKCQKRPSGFIIQAMPNGYSKITWVEHVEVPDQSIHSLSWSIISSGYAYGAKRWISVLKRQCERLACAIGIVNFPYYEDLNEIELANPEGRRSVLKLAERMVLSFYGGVTASSSSYNWTTLSGNGFDDVRIMARKSIDDPGRPSGVVLSASICFWIPLLPKTVFDYLRNESTRVEWDILSRGGGVQKMACISNGQDSGNCAVVLQVNNSHTHQGNMLILQESSREPTSSFIVYAPIDVASVSMLFGGGNPDAIQLLPSGFTIIPSRSPDCERVMDGNAITDGTLLSIAFQILVDCSPYAKLSDTSIATVNNLVEGITKKIKVAFGVD